jgi:hypothetical protein
MFSFRPSVLLSALTVLLLMTILAACDVISIGGGTSTSTGTGGTGSTPAVGNVQPVTVANDNALYTSVIICVPGTFTCQTVENVLVDTGSTGLRILASQLTLPLTYTTDSNNNLIGNCIQFAGSTYQWGPIANVSIQLAGEIASSVPMQIVGASNFPAVPTGCSAGGTPAQSVEDLAGANGILGVGLFEQDCGATCASAAPPAVYYTCPATGCVVTSIAVASQLQNPVWMFPQDNNGLAIVLPAIGASGGASVSGNMIFGIGTETNNALGTVTPLAATSVGDFTTTFNGNAYTASFIDSGSNGYFFLDAPTTGLPACAATGIAVGFYCPTSPVNLTAINTGLNPNGSGLPVSTNVAFSIANALTLLTSGETAFNNLGGVNSGAFDWGLPFFFGRTVFIGFENQISAAGTGPYWAY